MQVFYDTLVGRALRFNSTAGKPEGHVKRLGAKDDKERSPFH